jgi:hypothetical protein
MPTQPAPESDSRVRVADSSPLAIIAMGLGVEPADALALVAARHAETGRLLRLVGVES